MSGILRFSSSSGLSSNWLGEALLNWGFLRLGLNRGHKLEELPDHLRRDVGLPPRVERPADLRDWRW